MIYWELARTIRAGGPYEIVDWGDIPHFALRTPGYPLFLAACQAFFGERTLAVRLVQAAFGTVSVYLVYRLTRQIVANGEPSRSRGAGHSTLVDSALWSPRRWPHSILITWSCRLRFYPKRFSSR